MFYFVESNILIYIYLWIYLIFLSVNINDFYLFIYLHIYYACISFSIYVAEHKSSILMKLHATTVLFFLLKRKKKRRSKARLYIWKFDFTANFAFLVNYAVITKNFTNGRVIELIKRHQNSSHLTNKTQSC
jgi:hypothetical protein